MADDPKPKDPHDAPAHGLSVRERWSASLIGLTGIGAGGVGVFLSDNQAGTTAILLLGAVFLLMGVQGTAIIKAGKESVELERRSQARKLTDRAEELVEEKKPDAAAELVEAAKAVDPSLKHDANLRHLSGEIYERQVLDAIQRTVQTISASAPAGGGQQLSLIVDPPIRGLSGRVNRLDALVSASGDPQRIVGIEIKNTARSNLADQVVYQALELFREADVPGIVVSNRTPGLVISDYNRGPWSGIDYDFVLWRDERDDPMLEGILRKMLQASHDLPCS